LQIAFDDKIGGWFGFRNPLQGDLQWGDIRKALEEVGYDGYVTAEVPGYKTLPDLGLKHVTDCLRAVFVGTRP
jgi:L-ribulose-5-phosphate 3-epimerase